MIACLTELASGNSEARELARKEYIAVVAKEAGVSAQLYIESCPQLTVRLRGCSP